MINNVTRVLENILRHAYRLSNEQTMLRAGNNTNHQQYSSMDLATTTAGWVSFGATAIGLSSLITQANGVQDRLDPYHTSRTAEYLRVWIKRQPRKAFCRLTQPKPVGPVTDATLIDGFRGFNIIGVGRLPSETPGKITWTALLAILHEQALFLPFTSDTKLHTSGTRINLRTQYSKEDQNRLRLRC